MLTSRSVIILCIGIINYEIFCFMTPRKLQYHKESILKELRFHITSGKVTGEERCFISLPTENAQCGHTIGENLVVVNIFTLDHNKNLRSCKEICKLLQHYARYTIPVELNLTPSLIDRAFYPMPCIIIILHVIDLSD